MLYFLLFLLLFFGSVLLTVRRVRRGARPSGWSTDKSLLALAIQNGGFLPSTALTSREPADVARMLSYGWIEEATGKDFLGEPFCPGWTITEVGRGALAVLR